MRKKDLIQVIPLIKGHKYLYIKNNKMRILKYRWYRKKLKGIAGETLIDLTLMFGNYVPYQEGEKI